MATEGNKEKIVETALGMFNTRGLRGVTMDDIAQELHMSKRTLYETFANKEELLAACLTLVHDRTAEMHRQAHMQVEEPLLISMYMLRTNALFIHKYRRIIEETERYYIDLHDRFFKVHSTAMRELVQHGLNFVAQKGYLRKDADVAVAVDFLCNLIQQRRLSEVSDLDAYKHQLNEICYTYMRGLMTTETLQRYENEVTHFEQVINGLDVDNMF